MKIIAQLPGVNRPLSVELRLINCSSTDFDSQEETHTAPGQLLLTKRSDFRSAEGLLRCSPFGGAEFGKKPGRYRRFVKRKLTAGLSSFLHSSLVFQAAVDKRAPPVHRRRSALIREASVVGLISSNSAAPPGPKTLPPLFLSAAVMLSRSWRFQSSRVRTDAVSSGGSFVGFDGGASVGGSSKCNGPLCARMTARSTAFWSSRMLPGQS